MTAPFKVLFVMHPKIDPKSTAQEENALATVKVQLNLNVNCGELRRGTV